MRLPPAAEQRLGFRRVERKHALVQHSLGIAMLLGRFMMILPMLAIAGNLAEKKRLRRSLGTFPVTGRCLRCC